MSGEREERGAAGDAGRAGGGDEELVAVARVVKVRGLRGEVAAELLTDFPERFERVEELIAVTPAGERRTLAVEQSRLHAGRVLLKFAGFDTPEAARELVGFELTVPESEAVELEEGEFFDWQLEGCRVEDHLRLPLRKKTVDVERVADVGEDNIIGIEERSAMDR